MLSPHFETVSSWLARKAEPVKAAAAPATKALVVADDRRTFLNISFLDFGYSKQLVGVYCVFYFVIKRQEAAHRSFVVRTLSETKIRGMSVEKCAVRDCFLPVKVIRTETKTTLYRQTSKIIMKTKRTVRLDSDVYFVNKSLQKYVCSITK